MDLIIVNYKVNRLQNENIALEISSSKCISFWKVFQFTWNFKKTKLQGNIFFLFTQRRNRLNTEKKNINIFFENENIFPCYVRENLWKRNDNKIKIFNELYYKKKKEQYASYYDFTISKKEKN